MRLNSALVESSESVQDYLKAIYSLTEAGGAVATSSIAERLAVSPASVTAMIKRLSSRGHLRHTPYQGVELTTSGRALALEVIRHHRLLESYLHTRLGVPWDRVHEEAEILEHAISEDLEDRISEALGNPTHDPHGDPIPPKIGKHREVRYRSLEESGIGRVTVERVSDRDPEALRYLGGLGLVPGAAVTVEESAPFGGPLWVKVGKKRHALSRDLAQGIFVSAAKRSA